MSTFQAIQPQELSANPFTLIGTDWMLVTAGDSASHYNTMTASWGGVGVIWNREVATIYIRPQRYTFSFLEEGDTFTLSFFGQEHRKALAFCGAKSGRDYDKAKECGLTPVEMGGCVAFAEANLVIACKKLYWNDIDPQNFCDPSIGPANYPSQDYHRMYIGEITGVYRKGSTN